MTRLSMFKKGFSLLLAVLMLLILPGFAAAEGISGDYEGVHWELDAEGTLTMTSENYWGMSRSGPWGEYKDRIKTIVIGKGISSLASTQFMDYDNLTAAVFGPDLKNIGFFTFFECRNLKTVTLKMKEDCFYPRVLYGTVSEVVLGEGCPYVMEGDMMFTADRGKLVWAMGKDKAIVPDGVKTIGAAAFYGSRITEVVLPETLDTIMNDAFESSALQSVVLPASLKKIGSYAFSSCSKLKEIQFLGDEIEWVDTENDYSDNNAQSVFTACQALTQVTLPKCRRVPDYCFNGCKSLKKVVLSEGTKEIGTNIFGYCRNIQSVFIPDSVEKIEDNAFGDEFKAEIHCHEGTYAESYAKEHGISYKLIKSVEKIELSESGLQIVKGKTVDLKAVVFPEDATASAVEWSSSDPAVATVKNGKVKAVGGGECDIIADAADGSGVKAVCHVVSILPVQGLQTKTKQLTLAVNEKTTVEVTIKPDNATIQKLEWSSSDEGICKVDDNGQIEAVGVGKCQIICATTDGSNKSIKIAVTVK